MRFALTIAYDGRPFEGWQSQRGGNTVQDHLLTALQQIDPEIAQVHGSGRTDSGVSADGQVAHFDSSADSTLDAEAWQRALNTKLPPTIRVMECAEVPADFHARFSATAKHYRYRVSTRPVLPPLDAGLAWRAVAEGSVVYADYGISKGMQYGIDAAKQAGRSVDIRHIGKNPK